MHRSSLLVCLFSTVRTFYFHRLNLVAFTYRIHEKAQFSKLFSSVLTINKTHFNRDDWLLKTKHSLSVNDYNCGPIRYTCTKSSTTHFHRNCWNCGRNTSPVCELFFCDCGVVQQPAIELTYFNLMHLDPCFDIDLTKLSEVFKETQKKLHPDKFSTKSETERKLAEEQSSLLNKAYSVLQKPLSRAIYLLEMKGVSIEDNSDFSDSELLIEVMEINEKISNIQNDCDLDEIELPNNSKIRDCVLQLSKTFKSRNYPKAKALTIKLRYYTTIQDRINNLRRSKLG